ncbi:Proline dehydrogenase 1, mitochondrial [Habropoda laboriosa]|uniref:Proline dehydrogenase 1, mitochondrial n=1 Tax=Habropoda laboriosa TaxID=597456 RepID=A0A0L7REA2_9HYME|nr:Proline dehydrogenase 1, mitochondrial [Habropoda laboriosa]
MAFLRTVPRCSAGKKLRKCLPLPVGFLENVTKPSVQLVQVHERDYTGTTPDVKPVPRQIDPLDLKFNDPTAAFKSKTTKELLRAYVVYQLCSMEYIAENNMKWKKFNELAQDLFAGTSSVVDVIGLWTMD